ncbi:hypothetical protein D4R87_03495 [bacterium]|nr:MAG: hypothetical protein D4R87_03495 [bacterium]
MPTLISVESQLTDNEIKGIVKEPPIDVARKIYKSGLIYRYKDIYDPFYYGGEYSIDFLADIKDLDFSSDHDEFILRILERLQREAIFDPIEALLPKDFKEKECEIVREMVKENIEDLFQFTDICHDLCRVDDHHEKVAKRFKKMSPEEKVEAIFFTNNKLLVGSLEPYYEIISIYLEKDIAKIEKADLIQILS